MIDIHNHILAGVDDGASNLSYALEMARIAKMSGTTHIIATPHYMSGCYEVPYTAVKVKVNQFNQVLKEQGIALTVYPGQEVRLDEKTLLHFLEGKVGTLNGSRYMLIELEEGRIKRSLNWIDELRERGVVPVIAHIEKYKEIYKNKGLLNELIQRECYMQCNVNGLNGVDGKRIAKWVGELMALECIHFIASDAHSVGMRNPEMSSGFEVIAHPLIKSRIKENARCILANKPIKYTTMPLPKQRGSLLKRRR